MYKRILKFFVYGIAGLLFIAIGAVLYFTSSSGENFIKNRLSDSIAQITNANVNIARLDISFPLTVNIEGVIIRAEQDRQVSLLEIKEMETSVEFLPVLKRQLSLKYLKLDGLVVDIKRDRDGDLYLPLLENLPENGNGGTPGKFKFRVGDIDILNSSLRIEGEEKEAGLHLEGMNFSLIPKKQTVSFKGIISSGEIRWGEDIFPLSYIGTEGKITGSRIKIDSFNLGAMGVEIAASGEKKEDGSIEGQVNFSGDIMEPARILSEAAPAGQLEGSGELYFGYEPEGNIEISKFSFNSPAGDVSGSGTYRGETALLKIEASRLDFATLAALAGYGEHDFTGTGEATAEFKGNPSRSESWNADASVRGFNLTFSGKDVPDLSLVVNFHNSRGQVHFESNLAAATADFTYLNGEADANFKFSEVSLGELSAYFNLEGPSGALQIDGTVRNFPSDTRLEAEAESSNIKYGEFSFKEVKLSADYSGGVLRLSSFKATVGTTAALSGSGRADLKKLEGSFNVDVDDAVLGQVSSVSGNFRREDERLVIEAAEKGMDLARILKIIPGEFDDYGGIIGWQGRVVLKEGGVSEGDLSFSWEAPLINQYSFSNIAGQASLSEDRVTIEKIEILEGPNSASLRDAIFFLKKTNDKIAIDRTRAVSGEVIIGNIDIGAVSNTIDLPFYLSGILNGALKLSGTPKNPEFAGNIDIMDGTFRRRGSDITAKDIDGSIKIEESVIELKSLTGKIEGAPFKFSGRADKPEQNNWNLVITGSSGRDGRVSLAGKVSPQKADLELTLDEFRLFLLKPFFEGVSVLDGAINGKLAIGGRLAAPTLRGTIKGEGINVRTKELIEPAENIGAHIEFTERKITVVQLKGQFSSGKFSVLGDIQYSPAGPGEVKLSVEGSGMGFNIPNIGTIKIDRADLNFTGKEQYFLKGDIQLKEVRVTADRVIASPEGQSEKGPADKVSLSLKIIGQRNVWMDNRLGRVRNNLDINVGGTLATPIITGQLTAVEGYVYYLDRKFSIKKGVVAFTDPVATKAVLDIEAQTFVTPVGQAREDSYSVTIYVRGEATAPEIELQSQPPLARDDILSLLTFGVTSKQLSGERITGRESDIGEIVRERAQSLTSRRITGLFTGEVETLLNLDEFVIEGDIFRYGSGGGPRLVATKQIFPRTEVTYSSAIGSANDRKIRLGYRLTDNFLLESTNESLGSTSIGLKYRLMLE